MSFEKPGLKNLVIRLPILKYGSWFYKLHKQNTTKLFEAENFFFKTVSHSEIIKVFIKFWVLLPLPRAQIINKSGWWILEQKKFVIQITF